jgi:hypothetical protein
VLDEDVLRRRLQVIEPYEVLGQPVVSPVGLVYRPILDYVTQPYRVTALPVGFRTGLIEAMARADRGAAGPL